MRNSSSIFQKCLFFCLAVAFFSACKSESKATPQWPRVFEIYIASDLPDKTREDLKKDLKYFIAGVDGKPGMQTGDILRIYDGSTRTLIGSELEARKQDRIPKLRLEHSEATIKALEDYLSSSKSPKNRSSLNLAAILSARQSQPNSRILLIGSAIYFDDVEAHDMRQGWLGDGYFNQPSQITIFSLEGKQANLQNAQVSIVSIGASWGAGASDNHKRGVARFWGIFTQECGGSLVYFDEDPKAGFKTLVSEKPTEIPIVPPRNKEERKLEILNGKIKIHRQPDQEQTIHSGQSLRLEVEATGSGNLKYQWIKDGKPIPGATQPVLEVAQTTLEHEGNYSLVIDSGNDSKTTMPVRIKIQQPTTTQAPPLTSTPTPTPKPMQPPLAITPEGPAPDWLTQSVVDYRRNHPEPEELPVKDYLMIGLRWTTDRNNGQDLDLHVRPHLLGKEELSFRNTKTAVGIHYKDFKTNPSANQGYEVVELLAPVSPESVEVWVNAYSGKDPEGFSGEVRLFYAGALRVFPFKVPAKSGNQGADVIRRTTSPNWTEIKISTKK